MYFAMRSPLGKNVGRGARLSSLRLALSLVTLSERKCC